MEPKYLTNTFCVDSGCEYYARNENIYNEAAMRMNLDRSHIFQLPVRNL